MNINDTRSLKRYIYSIRVAWKREWADRTFRWKMLIIPGLFFVYSSVTQHIGNYIEMRKGVHLDDKLLTLFPTYDFSFYVFLTLYVSLLTVIITHLNKPRVVFRVLEMHFLVAIVRQVCILLVALEPPAGLIVLRDMFLENTVYPPDNPLTKDLFFSGHVASIWIYFLCTERRLLRYGLAIATLFMSFMILSMRVHYTYDVYGAIFFTTLIYFAPSWVRSYFSAGKTAEVVNKRINK